MVGCRARLSRVSMIRVALPFLLLLGAAAATGAVLFAWTGLYNVAASEGHWPVTRWFLEFAMRRSVATHALGVEPPPPFTEAMFRRGLGHFTTACAPCHGAPGEPRNEVVRNMVPPPPDLATHTQHWRQEQLFWIVKHGLKYTGMPSWPAQQRDDEVWAMVAFLERLPKLTPQDYEPLARGAAPPVPPEPMWPFGRLDEPARSALATCARCHGPAGEGDAAGAFPRLAGQSRAYLLESLRSYATGRRPSGIMQPVAVELRSETMLELARYFASIDPGTFPSRPAPVQPDQKRIGAGARIARAGVPERAVPACHSCHDPQATASNPLYPSLAGQPAEYLLIQLQLWQRGVRGGGVAAEIMARLADGLRPAEMEAVAAYFASLPPGAPVPADQAVR
jgi:cytochrome c553